MNLTNYSNKDYLLELLAVESNFGLLYDFQSDLESSTISTCLDNLTSMDLINYTKWALSLLDFLYTKKGNEWLSIRKRFSLFFKVPVYEILGFTRPQLAEYIILLDDNVVRNRSISKKNEAVLGVEDIRLLHEYSDNNQSILNEIISGKGAKIRIGQLDLQAGLGGLHSIHNQGECAISTESWVLLELDISSYYPTLVVQLLKSGAFSEIQSILPKLERFLKSVVDSKVKVRMKMLRSLK